MPSYQANPSGNNPTGLLLPGVSEFAFGSGPASPNAVLAVTSLTADGTTATIGVVLRSGYLPAIGDLFTITGTTASAGTFNVSNAPLTAVNINLQTGIGTVSFLLAQTLAPTNQAGNGYSRGVAVGELITDTEASKAFAIGAEGGQGTNAKTITMQVTYPSAAPPSTAVMALQGALVNIDGAYSDLISTSTLTTDLLEISLQNVRFVRARVSGLTGTNPKAIVRIAI